MIGTLTSCWLICCSLLAVQDSLDVARAIQMAHEANLAALRGFGEIEFQVDIGTARSLDAALRGEWASRHTGVGYYAYDGDNARYEHVYPFEELAAAGGVLGLLNGVSPWYVWRYRFEPAPFATEIREASPWRRICPVSAARTSNAPTTASGVSAT